MLYIERKIEFGREKVQRKNCYSRDGNSEKKVNWLTLHVKAMKYHKTVWGTQHAFYAGHFKFQSSQLWKNSLK